MLKFVILLFLCAGCSTMGAYTKEPTITDINLKIIWSTKAEIAKRCGTGHAACGTVGPSIIGSAVIWAEKPESFDDWERLRMLGHELMHSLGGDHARE